MVPEGGQRHRATWLAQTRPPPRGHHEGRSPKAARRRQAQGQRSGETKVTEGTAPMKTILILGCAVMLVPIAASAASRASANYSIPADTTDGGGRRATTAAYSNDG